MAALARRFCIKLAFLTDYENKQGFVPSASGLSLLLVTTECFREAFVPTAINILNYARQGSKFVGKSYESHGLVS